MSAPWFISFSGARTNMPDTLAQKGAAVMTAFESFAPLLLRATHLTSLLISRSEVEISTAQTTAKEPTIAGGDSRGNSRLISITVRTRTPPVSPQEAIM
jgi:hypothetical protein